MFTLTNSVVFILTWIVVVCQPDNPIVSTDYGAVRGFQGLDRLNKTYDGFLGVPYAKPPVGPLRWEQPENPDPWVDVLDTMEYSVHCIQPITILYPLAGIGGNDSEDCLYLNVFVPVSVDDALSNPRPVMVFYYGGGFAIGTTEMYPGEELATTGDVIVVSVNYRVSTMGFFSTGDSVAPGNYGLWDAKLSLEWVNANIAYFGGDPSRITVFGQSAGANLVSHLTLSSQTNQMFQRTIPISGSAKYYEDPKSSAEYLGDLFNCTTNSSQEIKDCLMEIDGKRLDNKLYLSFVGNDNHAPFTSVIDGTFVTQDTRESWKQGAGGHLDFLTGYTHHDKAGFVLNNVLALPLNRSDDGNKDRAELYDYLWNNFRMYDNVDEILQTLYERYPSMNDSEPAVASEAVSVVMTGVDYNSLTFYQAEKHVESGGGGATYFYKFQHRQSFLDAYPAWVNGSHLDDMYSVLGEAYFKTFRETWLENPEYSDEDSILSEIIMKYYANFAYTGNPNVGPHTLGLNWPEYTLTNREYLLQTPTPIIEAHSQEMMDEYNWFLYDFWGMLRPSWGTPLEDSSIDMLFELLLEISPFD